jgi:hypothetical protein
MGGGTLWPMISALAMNPTLTFNELKAIRKTTDGNVSVHARKLEEASYISCKKSFAGRVPRTEYSLTVGTTRAGAVSESHASADQGGTGDVAGLAPFPRSSDASAESVSRRRP